MKRDMNEAAQWRDLLHKKDWKIEALHRQIDWLTQQLRRLNGRVYGRSSERTVSCRSSFACLKLLHTKRCEKLLQKHPFSAGGKSAAESGKRIFPVFRWNKSCTNCRRSSAAARSAAENCTPADTAFCGGN